MSDVFISYHEKSAGELAEQIADALDDAGISAWCARRDMALGGNFAREIPNQIHDCRLFLLILNNNVYHSEHIENEVGIAFSRMNKKENIRILPLELGDFTRKDWVEYYLIHTNSMKLPSHTDEKCLQRLVKRIATALRISKAFERETQTAQPVPIPQATPEPPPVKIIKRGKCGDNVTFTLENGVLTISGTGVMWDFEWDIAVNTYTTPWWEERETITEAKIQCGVTKIGEYAFSDCEKLTSVKISDSVTEIGAYAFSGCFNLANVTIPDSVTKIRSWAFCGVGLTGVTIPDSVTEIGAGAFWHCSELTSVKISNSVSEIGMCAFQRCTELKNITIPNSVIKIGGHAFSECFTLANITIPDSVIYIGRHAFQGCVSLKSINIPSNAEIHRYAFDGRISVTRR